MNTLVSTAKKNIGDTCNTEIALRFTITGVFRETEHWRSFIYTKDAGGASRFWPFEEALEHASQFCGLDWLESAIQDGRVRLCDADADIWTSWKAALNGEVCHA